MPLTKRDRAQLLQKIPRGLGSWSVEELDLPRDVVDAVVKAAGAERDWRSATIGDAWPKLPTWARETIAYTFANQDDGDARAFAKKLGMTPGRHGATIDMLTWGMGESLSPRQQALYDDLDEETRTAFLDILNDPDAKGQGSPREYLLKLQEVGLVKLHYPTPDKPLAYLTRDGARMAAGLREGITEVMSSEAFWREQFRALDAALPRYKKSDWNAVARHYQASGLPGRDAGTPAHWYNEYRTGALTLDQAAKSVADELPNAERILGRPTQEDDVNVTTNPKNARVTIGEDRKAVGSAILAGGNRMNVANLDFNRGIAYAKEKFAEAGLDLYSEVPNFDKNLAALKKKMRSALDIPRIQMPVIEPADITKFEKDLNAGRVDIFPPYAEEHLRNLFPWERGGRPPMFNEPGWIELGVLDGERADDVIRTKRGMVPVMQLKPLQGEIWFEKLIGSLLKFGIPASGGFLLTNATIIVSKEGYILDGHHRFGQAMLADPSLKIKALKVPMDIRTLLKVGRSYGSALGNRAKESIDPKTAEALGSLLESPSATPEQKERLAKALLNVVEGKEGWLVSIEYEGPDGPELQNIGVFKTEVQANRFAKQNERGMLGGRRKLRVEKIDMAGRSYWHEGLDEASGPITVKMFMVILTSLLTQYDRQLGRRERKRGIENIYRLGHYLEAANKVEADVRSALNRDDAEAMDMLKKSLARRFDNLAPVNKLVKMIDAWVTKGKRPKFAGAYESMGLGEAYSFNSKKWLDYFRKDNNLPEAEFVLVQALADYEGAPNHLVYEFNKLPEVIDVDPQGIAERGGWGEPDTFEYAVFFENMSDKRRALPKIQKILRNYDGGEVVEESKRPFSKSV